MCNEGDHVGDDNNKEDVVKKYLFDAIAIFILGVSLAAYAHSNFATKSTVEKLDDRIYDLWKALPEDKRTAKE